MSRDAGEEDAPGSDAPGSDTPESDEPSSGRARRPAFAKSYPAHPKLDKLLSAYEAGDFGYVRSHAQKLAHDSEDEDLAAAAADLRRRIEPHPLATVLWALGLALLVLLFGYYLTAAQGH